MAAIESSRNTLDLLVRVHWLKSGALGFYRGLSPEHEALATYPTFNLKERIENKLKRTKDIIHRSRCSQSRNSHRNPRRRSRGRTQALRFGLNLPARHRAGHAPHRQKPKTQTLRSLRLLRTEQSEIDGQSPPAGRAGRVAGARQPSGCGFWIARRLNQMGCQCEVIAPSLIPTRSGDRVKTDKRDAAKLAKSLRSNDLVAVNIPDSTDAPTKGRPPARSAARRGERSESNPFATSAGHAPMRSMICAAPKPVC